MGKLIVKSIKMKGMIINRKGKHFLYFLGQDRYKSFTKLYLRGAAGCVIVADITNNDTILSALSWYSIVSKFFEEEGRSNIPFMLFLNKVDLIPNYTEQKEIPFSILAVDHPQIENEVNVNEDINLKASVLIEKENKNPTNANESNHADQNTPLNFTNPNKPSSSMNENPNPKQEEKCYSIVAIEDPKYKMEEKGVDFTSDENAIDNEIKKIKRNSNLSNHNKNEIDFIYNDTNGNEIKNPKGIEQNRNKEIDLPSDEDATTRNEISKLKMQVKPKKMEYVLPFNEDARTGNEMKKPKPQSKPQNKKDDFPQDEDATGNEIRKLKTQSHLSSASFPMVLETFKKEVNFLGFIETSAKENKNLKEGIGDLVDEIIKRRKEENKDEEGRISAGQKLKGWEEKERAGCCGS